MLTLPRTLFSSNRVLATNLMVAVALLVAVVPVAAQQLPAPAEPGFPQQQPLPLTELAPAPVIIPSPEQAVGAAAAKLSFVLRDLRIEGGTVYADAVLRPLYDRLVGNTIELSQLFDVARQIQERYRADGYLLARVIVPAQTVSDGVFRLQVVEGFISRVTLDGEVGPVQKRIRRYLDKLPGIRPIRQQDLERYLFLVNDIPGVEASGVLRKGEDMAGASELVVKVSRKAIEGYLMANNRGSKFTGPGRAVLSVQDNAATAAGERVNLTLFASEQGEQQFGWLTYEQLLGSEGLKLGLWAAYGPSDPGFTLAPLDVETESLSAGLSLTYPLIRSRQRSLYVSTGFEAFYQKVDILGEQFSEDFLRVVFMDAVYEFSDVLNGRSAIGLRLRQGLDALGASEGGDPALSRREGKPDFTALNLRATRYQPVGDRFGLNLAVTGQWAADPLLSNEEMRVGGEIFGRGYDPSELSGDHGLGLSLEPRYNGSWQLGARRVDYQAYAFYDLGVVWNRDSDIETRQSLASAGAGLRNRLLDHVFVDLELAWPLTRVSATRNDRDVRVFLELSVRF